MPSSHVVFSFSELPQMGVMFHALDNGPITGSSVIDLDHGCLVSHPGGPQPRERTRPVAISPSDKRRAFWQGCSRPVIASAPAPPPPPRQQPSRVPLAHRDASGRRVIMHCPDRASRAQSVPEAERGRMCPTPGLPLGSSPPLGRSNMPIPRRCRCCRPGLWTVSRGFSRPFRGRPRQLC